MKFKVADVNIAVFKNDCFVYKFINLIIIFYRRP